MNTELLEIDEKAVAEKYHLGSLAAKMIAASDLSEDQIQDLLNQSMQLRTSHAECIEKACERLLKARKNHEKVFVGGDYDADGITATAIMKDTLDKLGIASGYYIPDRFKEGYGLHPWTVEAAVKKGYTLIMTVDNGVKAHEAIEKCHELGVEIIVTDHHEIDEEIGADLVVHPQYMEDEYQYLSGAGVALEISRNLIGNCDLHTALASVAAIGDVMPLWKETRRIVKSGFRLIQNGSAPALKAMLRPGAAVNEHTVSFQIVPKLNAVGRMNDLSNVNTLVPFLLSRNDKVIRDFAVQIEKVNDARRNLSTSMASKAEAMMDDSLFPVLYDPSFHEGICGLAAGKLSSQYHKPVLVMTDSGEYIKGSARSVEGFNIFDFFSRDFDMLAAFGGHAMAAGISVRKEDFSSFKEKVQEKISTCGYVYEEKKEKAILISSDAVTLDHVSELELLKPYPKELLTGLFAVRGPVVEKKNVFGKVTKYHFANSQTGFDGVLFGYKGLQALDAPSLIEGPLSINRFRSIVACQMEIEGME